jgi:hypothetical protein
MAMQTFSQSRSRVVSPARLPGYATTIRFLFLLSAVLLCSLSARAQFQAAFVFASDPNGVAVYTRNDVTGVLTPVAGSPFASKESVSSMTLDFRGRYLFTANRTNSKISMFTIDPNSGALQEVPNSPFASLFTNQPVFLSTESSGQFLYVINFNGSNAFVSSVESFQINSATLSLVPSSSGATDLPGLFKGGATHPNGNVFYAYLNDPSPSNPNAASFLLFDSSNGAFTATTSGPGAIADCLALDPQAQFIALGSDLEISTHSLQPDGTLGPFGTSNGSAGGTPVFMTFDTLGQFLYVTLYHALSNSYRVHIFSPALLQELPNSPLPSSFPLTVEWTVNPAAPLIYADQVYQVDSQTGIPSPILATSPISPPAIFSRPPGSQPVVGPVALLSATSLSFGSLSVGQTSTAQTLTITSNGGQALSLNTLAIVGANSGDFTETDTCHAPTALQPGKLCSVLISFAPSAVGNRSATVTITDNASPSTESVPLSGIGLAPAPAVTIVPGTLDFGTMTQGTSTPSNIVVTNAGTATLHISGVTLGGANANDFGFFAPSCSNAIPVNATCTVTVTFTPLAAGLRSATITLTDDAPNSPQLIDVKGNANPAFSVTAAPGSSTTASVTAGQVAQYQMVLTPGPGYSGSVSFTCSGAPLGATCHVPPSVPAANGAPAPFTVTVSTSGAAILPPSIPVRFKPFGGLRLLPFLALAMVLLMMITTRWSFENAAYAKRMALSGAFVAMVFYAALSVGGCGGGSAAVLPPPPVITPTGTSTIVITPTAMSSSGRPLQLPPIQLTLTVK